MTTLASFISVVTSGVDLAAQWADQMIAIQMRVSGAHTPGTDRCKEVLAKPVSVSGAGAFQEQQHKDEIGPESAANSDVSEGAQLDNTDQYTDKEDIRHQPVLCANDNTEQLFYRQLFTGAGAAKSGHGVQCHQPEQVEYGQKDDGQHQQGCKTGVVKIMKDTQGIKQGDVLRYVLDADGHKWKKTADCQHNQYRSSVGKNLVGAVSDSVDQRVIAAWAGRFLTLK